MSIQLALLLAAVYLVTSIAVFVGVVCPLCRKTGTKPELLTMGFGNAPIWTWLFLPGFMTIMLAILISSFFMRGE